MKVWNTSPLLLSLQDAGTIGEGSAGGGESVSPISTASEPIAPPPETSAASDPFAALQDALDRQFAEPEPAPAEPVAPPVAEAALTGEPPTAAVPTEPVVEPPTPQARYSALFDLPPGDEGYRTAGELLTEFKDYDRPGYYTIAETVYAQERPRITQMVLEDLGKEAGVAPDVVKARAQQVIDYIKTGTGLPAPVQPTAFPALETVDQYGYIRLPNGRDIKVKDELGNEIAEGMEAYDGAKFRYEREQQDATRSAQEAEATRVQTEERERNLKNMERYATSGTFEDFHTASLAALDAHLEPALKDLATDEDKLAGRMMTAYLHEHLDAHPEAQKVMERLSFYLEKLIPQVVRQCTSQNMPLDQIKAECAKTLTRGRVADLVKQYNDLSRREAEAIKEQFINGILRRNKAELAATRTDPILPEGTQTITATSPIAPSNQPPRTLDEALEKVRGIVGPVLQ